MNHCLPPIFLVRHAGFNMKKSKNGKYISTPQQLFDRHCLKKSIDECWEWQGYRNKKNYGVTRIGGRNSKAFLAHRLSWTIHFGEIPHGMHVCHKCDNPSCVNPNHLFIGTNQDNIMDRVAKGRSSKWLLNAPRDKLPNTKIPTAKIPDMAEDRKNGMKLKDIAEKYGCCVEHACRLIKKFNDGLIK